MYSIKLAKDFITTAWKNGLGETTELAINHGGSLSEFDWRLSMAKVSQDGAFSNFKGYKRQLVLIKGNGIHLTHKDPSSLTQLPDDKLNNLLDMAEFDGGNETYAKLLDGDITDFNIITNKAVIESEVQLITQSQRLAIDTNDLLFVYSLKNTINIDITSTEQVLTLAAGELFEWITSEDKSLQLDGDNFIVIKFKCL